MTAGRFGDMQDVDCIRRQLQFFAQFARNRRRWVFIMSDPTSGQSPWVPRVQDMLDNQNPPAAVDDNGNNANRIARLQTAKHQVWKVHDRGIPADESRNLSCHQTLLHFLFTA